jgi:hypothetical protein
MVGFSSHLTASFIAATLGDIDLIYGGGGMTELISTIFGIAPIFPANCDIPVFGLFLVLHKKMSGYYSV